MGVGHSFFLEPTRTAMPRAAASAYQHQTRRITHSVASVPKRRGVQCLRRLRPCGPNSAGLRTTRTTAKIFSKASNQLSRAWLTNLDEVLTFCFLITVPKVFQRHLKASCCFVVYSLA